MSSKSAFLVFLASLLIFFSPTPVLARVLVKDGVKLPLVAENSIFPPGIGRVLVDNESPLFPEDFGGQESFGGQEPLSAYEILNFRKQARGEEATGSANADWALPESESGFGEVLGSTLFTPQVFKSQPSQSSKVSFEEVESFLSSGIETIEAKTGVFTETLRALGSTSLASTDIAGSATFGGTMMIDNGTDIDVVGEPLRLQPMSLGGIDFIAGKMKLDREGKLSVGGQLEVGGLTRTAGGLTTDYISPLTSDTVQVGQNLRVSGNLTTGDLSVTDEASFNNVAVTGVADFNTLLAKNYGRFSNLIVDGGIWVPTTPALPGYPEGTHASIGTATIFAGTTQMVIPNTRVSESSQIFITPKSPVDNLTLFVKGKVPHSYFVVGIEGIASDDIEFDWLMVN